ncbi:PKD domain-containing protein [Aquimarina spongiae]|uniref:PKD repeat-containing protein n=1 Tax=Aquimarina spongiae TaxID=570521 RepID=A0A1M6JN98_9FLAO|nr:PKD domain-containing protein [Aquimarina spongiae]SHJ48229.1 PKD repeat-containing protein [Aquimarina spongiae]
MRTIAYITILVLFWGCVKEEAIPVIVDFDLEVFNDDFSVPVQIVFFNRTNGAENYEWRFTGGSPSRSINRNPGVIVYETPGVYYIELIGTNQDGSRDAKIIEIRIDDPVEVDFEIQETTDNFSPASYTFVNRSAGATSYLWLFEGGTPSESTERDPEEVVFTEPGEHSITLTITNGRETYELQKTITVAPLLFADFTYQPAFEDDDYQVPVQIELENNSISATSFQWSFSNATPQTSNDENPEVVFDQPGMQTITLTASNSKNIEVITKTIEVFLNTNLRVFNDVRLGINTAHTSNTVGSFFSISNRLVYTSDEITNEVERSIDLVFFGLNEGFTRNRFVSPDQLSETTFEPFQNGKRTRVINSQELCNCTASLSVEQFDEIQDDTQLRNLVITETPGGLQSFDNQEVPRIVLFQTQEGRKGAIKIKQFVLDGQNSYIIVDIKVQKQGV